MPRLSVHMAARNSEATIERAVRSTLAALPRDAELVVADDASTDGTADRVLAIADSRLRLLRRSRSEGIGPARQHLLDATDSDFVATMDSDDVCLPWRFRTQLPHLERSVDLSFTSVVNFWEGRRRVRPGVPLRLDARAVPLHLLVMNMLPNATMAARRSVLVGAGGYRPLQGEDHDLWLRVIAAGGRAERLGLPGTAYRYHARQYTGQAGFTRTALAEEGLRDSYRTFVRARFGVEPTWLDALWSPESGTPRMGVELAPLFQLLRKEGAKLDPMQRALLGRTTRHLVARLPAGARP